MAQIKPFRGFRYNNQIFKEIDNLISPISDNKVNTEVFYKIPFNSILVSLPKSEINDTESIYQKAQDTLNNWIDNKIIIQDQKTCIYVYYQYFNLPDDENYYCRKGFICNVKISDWSENIILRHESTIPNGVEDRLRLLEKTKINSSPTHGIYSDNQSILDNIMDNSIKNPIYQIDDYQGVREVISKIEDLEIVKIFIDTLKNKKIIIADGHHRYESSLLYKKEMEKNDPDFNENKEYNYHLMYLTNSVNNDITIYPTHRIIKNIIDFQNETFLKKIDIYFDINKLKNECDIEKEINGKKYSFGLILKNSVYSIDLKKEYFNSIDWNLPEEVKKLDVTILHYFIIFKILGINENEQRTSSNIDFKTDFSECFLDIKNEKSQAAIITKSVSMEEIENVCYSGNVMPQKSTFFYPKVVCGFVFSSIKD